jgi:hypothetical protein
VASRQQHPQRLAIATATRRQRMVIGERLPSRSDGVQGVALGASSPRWPLGPPNLDHPLAAGLQELASPAP